MVILSQTFSEWLHLRNDFQLNFCVNVFKGSDEKQCWTFLMYILVQSRFNQHICKRRYACKRLVRSFFVCHLKTGIGVHVGEGDADGLRGAAVTQRHRQGVCADDGRGAGAAAAAGG